MSTYDSAKKFGRYTTNIIGTFALVASPVVGYQFVDEGINGADHTTLSETSAKADKEYLQQALADLAKKSDTIKSKESSLSMHYRIARQTDNFEMFNKTKEEIDNLKTQVFYKQVDFYNNIYTNRSMSENDLEKLMHEYRVNYGQELAPPANINVRMGYGFDEVMNEDNARKIRECQIAENMDGSFVEPTARNATEVSNCVRWENVSDDEGFFAVIAGVLSFLAAVSLIGNNTDKMRNGFENLYVRRKQKKEQKNNRKAAKLSKN